MPLCVAGMVSVRSALGFQFESRKVTYAKRG